MQRLFSFLLFAILMIAWTDPFSSRLSSTFSRLRTIFVFWFLSMTPISSFPVDGIWYRSLEADDALCTSRLTIATYFFLLISAAFALEILPSGTHQLAWTRPNYCCHFADPSTNHFCRCGLPAAADVGSWSVDRTAEMSPWPWSRTRPSVGSKNVLPHC